MSQEFSRPTSSDDLERNDDSSRYNNTTPPKRNWTWIYWAIIALSVGLNIYLFSSRNTVIEQRDEANIMYASSDSSRRAVEEEYKSALYRLDQLVSKNAQLDSLLQNSDSEVSKLKDQINKIINDRNATLADLGKAKRLIARLNTKVKTYEERIAELEKENKDLTDINLIIAHERDSAVTENEGLSKKVKLGAVLHASNIRMQPIDLRRNGTKEKTTTRAKRVDVLRVLFDIDENRVADDGRKEIFLRITGPSGNVLSNAAYGSGVTTTYDGESLNYTLSKQIDLKQGQPVKNVVVDWNQDSDYERGAYQIEIFNEGYKIGSGSVTLK
jgi:hypothetical protein